MLCLLPFVGVALATHVTTFDVNANWTQPPFSGLESLVVDPVAAAAQLQPRRGSASPEAEPKDNEAPRGERALAFTNPLSQWAEVSVNDLAIGIIGPYATMRLEGLAYGGYTVRLHVPTGRERVFSVKLRPALPVPKPIAVNVTRDRVELSDTIYFELDSAVLLSQSYGLLDAVADALLAHPELLVVRVEGHTDSRGETAYNQSLSEARAAAVRAYLVAKNVPAERLTSAGFGESRPVDPADTEQAWDQNRRVELLVEKHVEDEAPPEPVEPPKKKGRK